jgi:hypothetical protein
MSSGVLWPTSWSLTRIVDVIFYVVLIGLFIYLGSTVFRYKKKDENYLKRKEETINSTNDNDGKTICLLLLESNIEMIKEIREVLKILKKKEGEKDGN